MSDMDVTGARPDYLSPSEVADLIGTTRPTVVRWIKAGRLPAYRFGRFFKIERSDVEAFVAAAYSGAGR